ncbi:MAG TPA: neutral/alkaline non-lysosomal ceramidase N-terminal domain-containing protein [Spirochaetia bacterium]|nr:neutral/alkaline non-lysosomal ceramidase N-terminal domain-containing protein [Spirochaetia bacterium]
MKGLKAGLSEVVITPPVGVRLSGYADRTGPSTGILDELYAKALVLDNGERRLALVVCDVLGLSRSICEAIRDRVQGRTGIDGSDVLVAATHTHCGPDIDRLPEASLDHLVAQAGGAVWAASRSLREANLGFGEGTCLAGVSRRNPRSPRVPYHLYSYPQGTMDPRVLVMTVRGAQGERLGAVVNYPCHPVTLGWEEMNLSKDFVEYTCAVLKGAWGPDAVPIFLQGCAANVNPRWVYDKPDADPILPPDWPQALEDRLRETRRLGHLLGGEALKAAETNTRYEAAVVLDARRVEVELPARSDLDLSDDAEESRPAGRYPGLRNRLRAQPRGFTTEVQVLRMGDAFLIGLPGEVFVEYQIELRETLAGHRVFVSELAGDSIGYLPTPAAVIEGGYEPTATYAVPEAGAALVQAALRAAREMVR